MPDDTSPSEFQSLLDRLSAGDAGARERLIELACERLKRLTRKMFADAPGLRRWEDSADVFQNAVLRFWNSLQATMPATPTEFFRLAALNIRRELIDLCRHHFGPEGSAAHRISTGGSGIAVDSPQSTFDPSRLTMWTEFHERVALLPDDERELFDLMWYQGLTHPEAAGLLAVPERTLRRRWRAARARLYATLRGGPID